MAMVIAFLMTSAYPQQDRGKAELKSPGGTIVVDYGRPQLKGRDPLTWQQDGTYWRMGMNDITAFTTPVDLLFGSTKIAKGTYGLWLHKVSADRYELVFNSQSTGMGMSHDKSNDIGSASMKMERAAKPVELFTIDLAGAQQGGAFVMTWGTTKLSTDFKIAR